MRHRFFRPGRALETRSRAWIGAISIAVIAVVVATTTAITQLHWGEITYSAEFGQAAGIRTGDQVTVAGVPVGTVDGTELAGDRVLVTMKIHKDVPVGADSTAAIKLTTVLGARELVLRPAGAGIPPHRRIPLAHTTVPYDLQKLLQDSTGTFEQVDADQFARSMQALAAQLRDTPAVLPDALANVQNLSKVIADRRGEIGSLLRNTAQLATILGNQQSDMGVLVTQGGSLVREIVSRRAAVVRLLDAATNLVHTADGLLKVNHTDIDGMLTDIRQLTALLGDHDALLRNMFQVMPVALRNIANATGSGPFLDFLLPGGLMMDSWMCAIAAQAGIHDIPAALQSFKDCQ
ncbi:MCE family protein [Nocardia sp. NBC_01503]|uniref:MCE family protein n=1 Tax=Nocardia sp. NBC_01503 TaxID=2975997 RepID=UPI002E7C2CF7|nr:MCE family protein [Nocardia sp. NBC_01503]WTL31553.1 MCE family protein [Nocardia sp. NBC_01503]